MQNIGASVPMSRIMPHPDRAPRHTSVSRTDTTSNTMCRSSMPEKVFL